MTTVFADTAFYVALTNARDALHPAAVAAARRYTGRILTTEFVLTEVANFHTHPDDRPVFQTLLDALRGDPNTSIVPASTDLFERGVELFAARADKHWSLTDCTSFVVMTDAGVTHALTADRHFIQAGFTIEFT